MALFSRRPLCLGCLLLIAVTAAFFFLDAVWRLSLLCALLPIWILLFTLLLRRYSYQKLYLLVLVTAMLLGGARTALHLANEERLTEKISSSVSAELEVLEVNHTNSFSAELLCRTESINGEKQSSIVVVSLAYASPFYVGDCIEGRFTVQPLTFDNYYEGQAHQYRAEGAEVILVSENAKVISLLGNERGRLSKKLADLRESFAFEIRERVDGEAGELLVAMLLGERSGLSAFTVTNFRRVGVSHILALSGLHLSIIAVICDRLLFLLGRGKRTRIATTTCLLLGYLFLTGCSISMMRAVFMLLLVYLSFFAKQNADALTSLSVAGAIILCITPYAVFSVSYQLTMLATFGILAFSGVYGYLMQKIPRKKGILRLPLWCLRFVLSSLLVSLAASFAILPVQWLTFGEFSIMTPLGNLLLVPLATPLLTLGVGVLFLYPAAPFAAAARCIANVMLQLTEVFARADTMMSLRYAFVPYIIIGCMVLAVLLLAVDMKRLRPLVILPIALFIVSFSVCFAVHAGITKNTVSTVYRVDGKNEGIGFVCHSGTLLCDISGGSTTQLKNSWRALQGAGATEIDVLMLTHYHSTQAVSLEKFLQSVLVRSIWLPPPSDEEDAVLQKQLIAAAEKYRAQVLCYTYDTALSLFDLGEITLSAPLYQKRSVEPIISLTVTVGESRLQYDSAARSEYLRAKAEEMPVIDTSYYIIGAHGPIPHAEISFTSSQSTAVLIASDKAKELLAANILGTEIEFEEQYRFLLQ